MDEAAIRKRIESLLSTPELESRGGATAKASELLTGALGLMTALYGPDSPQARALTGVAEQASKKSTSTANLAYLSEGVIHAAEGTLRNLLAELDGGLLGSLQKRFTGEVLTDFLQLGRAILETDGDAAKNVASVLAAAAFEDTIRRMGSAFAGVLGKDDLSSVLEALKAKGVLVSPQLGIAQSFLNFRNKALHANWNEIDRASVNSVLSFVQDLLLKHFQ